MRDATAQQALVKFGAALRTVREQQGLSQADLSAGSGLHRTTVARIEDGRAEPRFDTLMALRRGLGVPMADVLELAGERGEDA
ncbi:MAG: helix-turn-helix transcriptional regulator [Solirubrobacteraceae bacterium]|jgi:transcriptional regulator with XRE-family HTH domain